MQKTKPGIRSYIGSFLCVLGAMCLMVGAFLLLQDVAEDLLHPKSAAQLQTETQTPATQTEQAIPQQTQADPVEVPMETIRVPELTEEPAEETPEEPVEEVPEEAPEEIPEEAPEEAPPADETDGTAEWIFPDSSQRLLTDADVEGLSAWELKVARNEIYARHGRRFKDTALQAYFDSCSWYEGTIAPADFSDDMLSSMELANVRFLKAAE